MNRFTVLPIVAALAALGLTPAPGRADGQLSPERLDVADRLGYFTPGFKAAVRDLVDGKHALQQANAEKTKLDLEMPALQRETAEAEAKANVLRQELARYDHPEENDFVALQKRMNDAATQPEELIALAQAYVWTYPASPHVGDARQYLTQTQKKLADQRQAEKESEAARAAAHADLVRRAQARSLSLGEWRGFLRDMSQDDLVKFLGRPTSQSDDYWIYSGEWIFDPTTRQKVGMEINFNGARVLSVDEKPPAP